MVLSPNGIIVPDCREMLKITKLSVELSSRGYAPVLDSHGELLILEDGTPVLKYRAATAGRGPTSTKGARRRSKTDLECIKHFIDSSNQDGKNLHLLGLFQDCSVGREIELHFLLSGLCAGRSCTYILPENEGGDSEDSLLHELTDYLCSRGVDGRMLDQLQSRFRVIRSPDPRKHPDGLIRGAREITATVIKRSGPPPYAIVGHYISSWDSPEDVKAYCSLEKYSHSTISKFNGSFLCNYRNFPGDAQLFLEWRNGLLRSHHLALLARSESVSQEETFA